ncbi:MAG: recombinase family protein [Desulfovibrio sp.]|nr:recombinase family protein [Desulfovibrio sp.]
MDVFYFKDGVPLSPTIRTEFDETFSDLPDEQEGLRDCLKSLRSGDTLYVERESFLSDTVSGSIAVLRDLARRGVNVYLERTKKLIKSESSPYAKLTPDLLGALIGFRKAFNKLRQYEGYRKAREAGTLVFKRPKPLPENFEDVKRRWLNKEMPLAAAAAECEMAVSTFWRRCQE